MPFFPPIGLLDGLNFCWGTSVFLLFWEGEGCSLQLERSKIIDYYVVSDNFHSEWKHQMYFHILKFLLHITILFLRFKWTFLVILLHLSDFILNLEALVDRSSNLIRSNCGDLMRAPVMQVCLHLQSLPKNFLINLLKWWHVTALFIILVKKVEWWIVLVKAKSSSVNSPEVIITVIIIYKFIENFYSKDELVFFKYFFYLIWS